MKPRFLTVVFALIVSAFFLVNFQPSASSQGVKFMPYENGIPDRYLVVLNTNYLAQPTTQEDVDAMAIDLTTLYGGDRDAIWHSAIQGFSLSISEQAAMSMSEDYRVNFIEQDRVVYSAETQSTDPIEQEHLDRIDQRFRPVDLGYSFSGQNDNTPGYSGVDAHAYVVGSGIRHTHNEFLDVGSDPPITRVSLDYNEGIGGHVDCTGHETHVAGIIGGNLSGVAKRVRLHSIRIQTAMQPCTSDPEGETNDETNISLIVGAIDWITLHPEFGRPAVVNISYRVPRDPAFEMSVTNSIQSGVHYVISAANDGGLPGNQCNNLASGHIPSVITVGALTFFPALSLDTKASYSNWGPCVDIFAFGNTYSASHLDDDDNGVYDDFRFRAGTSFSAPAVAGAVALYISRNPGATPAQVKQQMIKWATVNQITDWCTDGSPGPCASGTERYPGTPNRILYTWLGGVEGDVASRPSGDGQFGSSDVVAVRNFVSGIWDPDDHPEWNEFQRADLAPLSTHGDGQLLSTDVVQSRRYVGGFDSVRDAAGPTEEISPRSTIADGRLHVADDGFPRRLRVVPHANPTGPVTVSLMVDASGNEAEYAFTLNYPAAALTNPIITNGNTGNNALVCNTSVRGRISCSAGDFQANGSNVAGTGINEIPPGSNQLLLTITFNVAAGTPIIGSPQILAPLTFSNVNVSNDGAALLTIGSVNGTVLIDPIQFSLTRKSEKSLR